LPIDLLPTGLCTQAACILEVTTPKPGNVNRWHDFEDATLLDFLLSAAAIAPVMEAACTRRVGETALAAVRATRRVTRANTNLGIVLLLAPLAAVPREQPLRPALQALLDRLDVEDSRLVYEAIRLAAPGGLGHAPEQDVSQQPTLPLRQIMALAGGRDLVARQYANGFREVLDEALPVLGGRLERGDDVEAAIIACHLHLMTHHPDTLIARKRGQAEAEEASRRARIVLDQGWPENAQARQALTELDAWLRAQGHSRNPGTSADLTTACLFVALREGIIQLPAHFRPAGGEGVFGHG
jgi:triphosphoribosyl-dephospho-CoA synthase